MAKKKKKPNNFMDIGIPTIDDIGGGKGMGFDFGFENNNSPLHDISGDLSKIAIPSFEPESDRPNPHRPQRIPRQQSELEEIGFDWSKMFQPKNQMSNEVKTFMHRGKKMVEDPENPNHIIPLSTYKKRYGNSTRPERQTRNNIGNNNLGEGLSMLSNLGRQASSIVKDKLADRKYQSNAPKLKVQRDVEPIKYVVYVTWDDGSTSEVIEDSLVKAQTKQRQMLSDPHVRNAEINYL